MNGTRPFSRPTNPEQGDDEFVVFIVLPLAAVTVLGSAGVLWLKGVEWLVAHQVLVAGATDPVLALPWCGGAGLDWPRLSVLAGAVLALLAWGVSSARRAVTARREIQ